MTKFALRRIGAVVGKQRFDELIIDGKCPFEEFYDNYINEFRAEINRILAAMNDVANLKSLPKELFHPYSDGKDGMREYEFKTKHLRVYALEQLGGKIIVMGGTKAKQKKDESQFHDYKKKYMDQLKKNK